MEILPLGVSPESRRLVTGPPSSTIMHGDRKVSFNSCFYLNHSRVLPKTMVKSQISGGEMFAWRSCVDRDSLRSLKSWESLSLAENHNRVEEIPSASLEIQLKRGKAGIVSSIEKEVDRHLALVERWPK
ncbi:hypothetical protein JCGZ_10437 [Jatropha curcas]|uniref:Uncharacterized protein n=1 Tax=Jatropha curcas TaxID=180498 RepID=A0A067KHW5_JATCU|nr:hypothetical protein JCGZ_10437 [Jatropha curcas]